MYPFLPMLAPYLPPPLLRQVLANPVVPTQPAATHQFAAVLFVDVSGFTPLTESLAQHGTDGAEELTGLLNRYFQCVIPLLTAEGGEIVKFSGDALTVLFAADTEAPMVAVRRALQAAEALQAAMRDFQALPTSAGPVSLGMKIGIGVGTVVALQVGGVYGRWEYVVAGDPLAQVATAESQAIVGEIRLSPEATARCYPHPLLPRPAPPPALNTTADPLELATMLRCYIPGATQGWLGSGLRDWMGVLRPMSVLFLGVGGLDYTHPQSTDRLHALVCLVQETIYQYEGSLNKVVVDDKGTVILVLFGAPPLAHEDDALRAVCCALAVHTRLSSGDGAALEVRVAMGIATGRVFAGPVGSDTRREYTAMGDTVNLAARLMGQAGDGGILCSVATYQQTRTRVQFDELPPRRLKGKAGLVRVYRPLQVGTPQARRLDTATTGSLVGRQHEVAHLTTLLEHLEAGAGHVLILEGEAGIGKSRLVAELAAMMRQRGLAGLLGSGQSSEQQVPYRPWREILRSYFDLEPLPDRETRQQRVQQVVREVAPAHQERVPLLNDMLDLTLPDTTLTRALDAELRQQNLMILIVALLKVWSYERPLIIVLEDAQWLDRLSWTLTIQLARSLLRDATHPILVILVTRPLTPDLPATSFATTLRSLACTTTLELEGLPPAVMDQMVAGLLGVPPAAVPAPVAHLVHQRAGGNPFFAEELTLMLRDREILTSEPDPHTPTQHHWVLHGDPAKLVQTLPETVQGLILARVDRLPPERQLVLKVAAVIGDPCDETTLRAVLGQHMTLEDAQFQAHLHALHAHGLLVPDPITSDTVYHFKHSSIQEVTYQTLLRAQRQRLHTTIVAWYETTYLGTPPHSGMEHPPTPTLPASLAVISRLVHHAHYAADPQRERVYARLAGEQAAAQFANEEAVTYLSRALDLTPPPPPEADAATTHAVLHERYDLLLLREHTFGLLGTREAQAHDLEALQTLVETLGDARLQAQVALRRAAYADLVSDFRGAQAAAWAAIHLAQTSGDGATEAAGYLQLGTALLVQADYTEALPHLLQAQVLAQDATAPAIEARILLNMGNMLSDQGNLAEARDYYIEALRLYQAIGDRVGEEKALGNLGCVTADQGYYDEAQRSYAASLQLGQEIGDHYTASGMLCNLGGLALDHGDYATAQEYFAQALQRYREIGSRDGESIVLCNLCSVAEAQGAYIEASLAGEQALEIALAIEDRYGQGFALNKLGHALVGLERWDAAATTYQQALAVWEDLDLPHMALEAQAGLAAVARQQQQHAEALAQVETILVALEEQTLDAVEEPLRIYRRCYEVLRDQDDPRAAAVLAAAGALLLQRARRIDDTTMRHSFLTRIPTHHWLQQEQQRQGLPGA